MLLLSLLLLWRLGSDTIDGEAMVWLFLLLWLACSHVHVQVGDLETLVVDLRISLAVRIIAN